MKKLITLMLGMALVFTTVAVTFAEDPPRRKNKKHQEEEQEEATTPRRKGAKRLSSDILLEAA